MIDFQISGEPSVKMGLLKFSLSVVFVVLCIVGSNYYIEGYQAEVAENTESADSDPVGQSMRSDQIEGFEKALESMKSYSALMTNWSIILFAGTIGIAVLGKGARIWDDNWSLVFIPPTWALLYYSVWFGNEFGKKVAYQYFTGDYILGELNDLLDLQQKFFAASLVPLVLFASVYLVFRFAMYEQKTDRQ